MPAVVTVANATDAASVPGVGAVRLTTTGVSEAGVAPPTATVTWLSAGVGSGPKTSRIAAVAERSLAVAFPVKVSVADCDGSSGPTRQITTGPSSEAHVPFELVEDV